MVGRESMHYVIHRNELPFSGYSDVTSQYFFSSERKTLHDCGRSETEIGFGFASTLFYCIETSVI